MRLGALAAAVGLLIADLAAAAPYFVADINKAACTSDGGSCGSSPTPLGAFQGALIFEAWDRETGRELWKSDGTDPGTLRIADINPGPPSSEVSELVVVGDEMFFVAQSAASGLEVWRSDGTAQGTSVLVDVVPGAGSSIPSDLLAVDGTLYFIANFGLWRSDGASAGTTLVKQFAPFTDTALFRWNLTRLGNSVFFARCERAGEEDEYCELWKSDGTATSLVQTIRPATRGRRGPALLSFVPRSGFLLFAACEYLDTCELWRSDGTTDGTTMVAPFDPSDDFDDDDWNPPILAPLGDDVLFAAIDANGEALWKSDGTPGGTVRVAAITNQAPNLSNAFDFLPVGTQVFFHGIDPPERGLDDPERLWRTDGTAAGTLALGPASAGFEGFTNVDGTLFWLRAWRAPGGFATHHDIWRSDGTPGGTRKATTFPAGARAVGTPSLFALDGTLFFGAADEEHGVELWALSPCDDDDACTDDTRADGACLNLPASGLRAISCHLGDDPFAFEACSGATPPSIVARRVARIGTSLAGAEQATSKRARRRVRSAMRMMSATARGVERWRGTGIPSACADELAQALAGAKAAAAAWMASH